jgi:hypothetical protein
MHHLLSSDKFKMGTNHQEAKATEDLPGTSFLEEKVYYRGRGTQHSSHRENLVFVYYINIIRLGLDPNEAITDTFSPKLTASCATTCSDTIFFDDNGRLAVDCSHMKYWYYLLEKR